jgi:outer membrane protein
VPRGMYMNVRIITALLFAGILLTAIVPAGAYGERSLTLKEALSLAEKGNPEILASSQSMLAAREDIGIARSFLLPKITFEERFMRTNNPTYAFMAKLNQARFEQSDFELSALNHPTAVNDFQTGLSFEQPVFAPKAYIAVDMAKRESTAKGEEFARKREDVVFRVVRTYLGVQTAKAFVQVAEKAVGDAKEHERIAEARYNSGLGLYSDLLRARVAVASAEEKLVSALRGLKVAKRAFGLTLGLTESMDAADERPALAPGNLDYYYNAALSRSDLKSLQERYRNAENSLRMANAGYLPVFGIGGSYQLNSHRSPFGDEGDSWQMSAFLRWELFDGVKREHERQKAKHTIAESAAHLDGMKKQISFMVYDAYLGVEEARKGLDLAHAALKSAEEGRRLVKTRYENSLSTIADLLDVQTSLDGARATVVDREGAYLTAVANLGFQSGTIMRDLGLQE